MRTEVFILKSDLTCPIEVETVQVDKGSDGEGTPDQIVCRIGFLCLTGRVLDSVQMNIVCFDAQGTRLGGRLVRASVHPMKSERHYEGSFMPEHVEDTTRVEAAVEKVWYKDGLVWRREERNVREYIPNTLAQGRELDRLRAVAGQDAMGYPREEDVLWMCVCGRANPIGEQKCFKCGRERMQVLRDYSFQAIDSTIGRRERNLEEQTKENLRRSSEQTVLEQTQQQMAQDKKSRRARTVVVVLTLVAFALALYRWGVPMAAVYYGKSKLANGLTEEAKTAFDWVQSHWPDQFGAQRLARQAEEEIISQFIATNTKQSLEAARVRANALPNDEGKKLAEQASLALGQLLTDSGDVDGAQAIYRSLPNSEEASLRLQALMYAYAEDAQDRHDYPVAIETFSSLGDYEDAIQRREDCIYLYGRQLLRQGQYQQAAEQFLQVSGMEDAIDLTRKSYYALAGQYEQAGDLLEAASLYESLGAYEDAELLARACRYKTGMEALEAGDLEEAAGQLVLAKDYEDANVRYKETVETLGARALEEGDPQRAIDWYRTLEPTETTIEALNEATYALAEKQEADGDVAHAAQTYSTLGDYADAHERADELEYGLALSAMNESPEEALARFELLGDYKDARDRAMVCRYRIAQEAYDAKEYERALEMYEELGDYEQSKRYAQRCRYRLAAACFEAGEFDEAAALYDACGAYLNAEEFEQRARYSAANALETEGKFKEAAEAFAALGSYENAPERTRSAQDAWLGGIYESAHMDMELGDYDSVIMQLEGLLKESLPERYADIPTMYEQACLLRADELIVQGKPLDALDALERIASNEEAKKRLDAYVYKLIGTWETASGQRYVFRKDGSCSLDGQEAYFGGKGYDIYIGEEPYPDKVAYDFIGFRNGTLTLRDRQTGAQLRMHYLGEPLDLMNADTEQDKQKQQVNMDAQLENTTVAEGYSEGLE